GGHTLNAAHNQYVPSDTVDIFDGATNQWSVSRLPHAGYGAPAAVAGSKVIVALPSQPYADVRLGVADVYDTQTGQWSTTLLSAPFAEPGVEGVNGQVVITSEQADATSGLNLVADVLSATDISAPQNLAPAAGAAFARPP